MKQVPCQILASRKIGHHYYIYCFLILYMLLTITGNVSSFFHHHFQYNKSSQRRTYFFKSQAVLGSYLKGADGDFRVKGFQRFLLKRSIPKLAREQSLPSKSFIHWDNKLVTCGLQLEPATSQTTILDVLWSTYEIKIIVSLRKPSKVIPASV